MGGALERMPSSDDERTECRPRGTLLAESLRSTVPLPSPRGSDSSPRAFCGIGVCLECETLLDGRVVRACLMEATR